MRLLALLIVNLNSEHSSSEFLSLQSSHYKVSPKFIFPYDTLSKGEGGRNRKALLMLDMESVYYRIAVSVVSESVYYRITVSAVWPHTARTFHTHR